MIEGEDMRQENYEKVIRIRVFEEHILELFAQNKLSGTTHTYIGEEATAVAIMNYIKEEDVIFSNHRCHGHYLAYGGSEKQLLAEIMSKESGLCQGRGGSQHIHYKNFFTNGIQGGIVPNAVGVAFSQKYKNQNSKTIVFIGDGTLGQGVVYESINIAAIYDLPILFVIEDNQYAMSTKREDVIAGNIYDRIAGFGIQTFEIESTDVDELDCYFMTVNDYIETYRKPACAIVHNYRLGAHSKGDDTRDPNEIAEHKIKDPVYLIEKKIGKERVKEIYEEYKYRLVELTAKLESDTNIKICTPEIKTMQGKTKSFLPDKEKRYVDGIREAFRRQLEKNSFTLIMGEDIRDPYGGAFKATKSLSVSFDKQIINMPISEACMIGLAVGMSMSGILPVVEMMFGDFITLGFDQLLNHASKYAWIYSDGIKNPMIVRVPSGAKRGYGPTHSQSLEKYLVGIPCINIYALSPALDPEIVYMSIFDEIEKPTIIIENKKLYGQKTWRIKDGKFQDFNVNEKKNYGLPTIKFSLDMDSEPDVVAITYGGMLEDTIKAAEDLMIREEIQVDVVALGQLSPLPIQDIKSFCPDNVFIVVIEEGTKTAGIGAEIITQCCELGIGDRYFRVATPDMPIPNGLVLEKQIIPDKEIIISEIKRFIR